MEECGVPVSGDVSVTICAGGKGKRSHRESGKIGRESGKIGWEGDLVEAVRRGRRGIRREVIRKNDMMWKERRTKVERGGD